VGRKEQLICQGSNPRAPLVACVSLRDLSLLRREADQGTASCRATLCDDCSIGVRVDAVDSQRPSPRRPNRLVENERVAVVAADHLRR